MPDEVSIDLKARDQMSSVLDHVTQRLGIFSKEGLAMGVAFAGVNLAIQALQQAFGAVVQFIQDGIEKSREFELSIARLSVSMNNFDISVTALKTDLVDLAEKTGADVITLAEGFRTFAREGYSASDSLKLLTDAEKLATITGEDLGTIEDLMARTMNAFNLGAGDSGHILEELNKITNTTSMSLGDVNTVLGRVAIAAHDSGISFDDLINLMYTLHKMGTNNRNMASELEKALKDLGNVDIDIIPDSEVTDVQKKLDTIDSTIEMYFKRWDQIVETRKRGIGDVFSQILEVVNFAAFVPWINNASEAVDDSTAKLSDWQIKLKEAAKQIPLISTELQKLNADLATENTTLEQAKQDLGDLIEMRQFTIDSHDATLAVQEQEDAIQALKRATDAYSLSQMKNNLEILKIQYAADSRHGLTRDEKEKIKALEHTNQGIQIQEQENQIAVAEIQQNGLQDAQDQLDAIRRTHDEAMYGQEIRDLDANIKAKNELITSTLTTITETNAKIAVETAAFRNTELGRMVTWSTNMHKWWEYAYGGDTPGATQGEQLPNFGLPRLPWMQEGGSVLETGAAIVHKGEYVLPAGGAAPVAGPTNQVVSISINAELRKDEDVEDWGRRLGAGLASGFLSGTSSGTTTVTSRKTGVPIIVPGTMVTTRTGRTPTATIPVPQPIASKGRFRVG